jgi:phage terminase large subunit GpA-like protein
MKSTATPDVPKGVLVLTAGVDINERTTNYEIVGWGPGYESWGIEYGCINEDPRKPRLWEELDRRLYLRRFTCGDGEQMEIRKIAIDAGFLRKLFTGTRANALIAPLPRRDVRTDLIARSSTRTLESPEVWCVRCCSS